MADNINEIRKKKKQELKEKYSGESKRVFIEIFVLSGCAHCPSAVEMTQRVASNYDNVDVAIVDIASKNGNLKARNLEIMSAPTIVINGKVTFIGTPQADSIMHDAIRKSM